MWSAERGRLRWFSSPCRLDASSVTGTEAGLATAFGGEGIEGLWKDPPFLAWLIEWKDEAGTTIPCGARVLKAVECVNG